VQRIGLLVVAVLVVAGCLMPLARGPAIKEAITPTMHACRMGWYDAEYRYPHFTMIPVYPGYKGDPCAAIPPCGDPPRRGAGPPCDSLALAVR
jgi:hypothetical protein